MPPPASMEPSAEPVLQRYTAFPNLYITVDPRTQADVSEVTFELPVGIIKENVILSWAILLRGYTGLDSVTFEVDDGQAVCVDFEHDSVEDTRASTSAEEKSRYTALYFDKNASRSSAQVQLYVDLAALSATLVASEAVVPRQQLHNIVHQLLHVTACLPTRPSSAIPPVSERNAPKHENTQLPMQLSILNPNPVKLPGPDLLHDLVQSFHGRSEGNKNAIEFLNANGERTELSYNDLERLSIRFAKRIENILLWAEAKGRNKTVPILLPQSCWLYVVQLAILKAGAAFVPLNLDAPEERIRFVVEDVKASLVITDSTFADKFKWQDAPEVIIVDADVVNADPESLTRNISGEGGPVEFHPVPVHIEPSDAAYIMYTSGSTGKPKGVTISHGAATQALLAHDKHIPQFERFLQFAAPTFDVSVFEIFFPFFRGSTLVGCDRGKLLADLPGAINELNIDGAELTPTVAGVLLASKAAVPCLKVLLTIGEMLTQHVVTEFGGGMLQGMYGPTEAAIHCSIAPDFRQDAKVGDIGIPFDTVSAFVVAPQTAVPGEDVEVLPVGWVGELAVGGYQLADGYLNRPDLTEAAFINSAKWGRLYRTGDRARILPDGRMECLGRVSAGQVKLRGQRIELGEIEQVALKTPGLNAAVASVIDASLVLFVSTGDKLSAETLEKDTVKDVCRQWLPGYMVPSDVVIYEHLPRLPSGKADRKRLENEYSERNAESNDEEKVFNETDTESIVAGIVKDLLGKRPRLSDSLVAMGLDSIQAIRLVSRLRAKGLRVDVVDVVNSDTVTGVATAATSLSATSSSDHAHDETFRATKEAGFSKIPETLRDEVEDIIPCTSVQESMIAETARSASSYCNWILIEIGAIPVATVETAFTTLVERNEILRTGFVALDKGFAQVIWKRPRDKQFRLVDSFAADWEISLDEMLEPPFMVGLMVDQNGNKKLGIHIHHALYDGWSWENVMSEFQSLLAGKNPSIRPQYREIVKHELSRSSESIEAAKSFWKASLEGAGETKLPNFHGRHDITPGVSIQSSRLSTSVSDLEVAARNAGVSPQVFAQSAWAYLLSSYVGNDDVSFGTVVSGRTVSLVGIEDIIGPTILTLPVRVQAGLQKNLADLLHDVHAFNRKLLEHPELSLREVRKECGNAGFFDSLIVWQQTANEKSESSLRVIESKDRLEFPLLIEIEPAKNDEILLRATYKDELFPATQVSVLLQQMDRLISGMVANHNRSLKALVMDLGVESVLSISNPYPDLSGISKTRTLATVFEDTAAKYPDAIALEFAPDIQQGVAVQTEKRTYAELNAAANRLARELVHLRGTVPDQLVAVCMEKSVLCYTSILATVKAGAGYLPLTPETPVERIKQILRNASVKILLSTQDVIERIGPIDGLDMLDVYKLDFSAHSPRNLGIKSHSKALAYAVFTSGSTGVPKGVLVEHEQTVANLDQLAEMYPTAVGKRALQFCNIAFDVSVFDIFFTWHRGMVLCSATKDVCLRDLEATINALGVTHLSMTPTVAALVNPNNVPTVEFLVTAGEAVTEKVFNDWAGRGLWQGYGPSETTNISNVKPRVEKGDDIGNFGPIFSNSSAFVVAPDEEELVLLPRGGVGELVIGGAQVVRGYLNLEELTARKFVVHADYGRVYRSGDIVRLLPNDDIIFVKRVDDQVKIRGNRIELGEINSVLLRNADLVLDSVTLVVSKDGSPHLVSFVASKSHHGSEFKVVEAPEVRATVKTLFKHLTEFVPAYMVPNAIVPVTEIPMTTQAKTDKRRLVAAYLSLSDELLDGFSEGAVSEEVSGEWNELEREVARIVAEVAQVEVGTIARTTSIFKLGLDSISAIGLSNKLKSVGLSKLDVSQIMKNSTIAALARVLGQQGGATTGDSMKGLQALKEFADDVRDSVLEQLRLPEDQIVKILPCTPLQESTLSTKKGVDPRTFYNHTVLNLTADAQRLKSAWQTTVHSLEILRTCFAVTSHHQHAFAQVVIKEHALSWSEQKLESDENLTDAIEEHITAVSAALDIAKPPYSFGLFTTPGKSALVMSFHHSLYDGFAMDLMLQDVQRAYVGAEIPARASFDSYLQYMESVDLAAADGFWKERLNGLELTAFPDLTGKSNSFRKNLVGMASRRISSSRTLSAINKGCRAVDSSLLALGQSAWARLLSVYTGESDICFGNVVSGRTIPVDGVETIVAPCFNTVPIRVQVLQDGTARSVMETLQTLNADIIPFQLTPLRRIMAALKTEGRALFDTLFILQHASENSFKDLWEELEDRGEMDFSVVVELCPDRATDALQIIVHFRRDLLLEEHANVLLQQFDATLTSALDKPDAAALDFSAFPAEILSDANASPTVLEPATEGLLHSDFERIVSEYPDRVALQFLEDDGSLTTLTFGDINARANKIANHLISLGVARDDAIPLCIDKSPLYYVCVIAVLKAGCAFTPIDPSLPLTRREFMISELQAKIILITGTTDLVGLENVNIIDAQQLIQQSDNVSTPIVQGLSPDALAYRIYTSGSTGLPKAVSVEHRNAVQTILASKSRIRWEPESRLLQFAATTFDMCYYDIFMAWSYGFTLCSAHKKYLLGELEATIKRLDVTMLDLTPTVAGTLDASRLPGVKLLYCIGEAMPRKLASDWEGRCVNSYGPTEAAMCCTIVDVSRDIKAGNIGKPFETTRFVVLLKDGDAIVPVFGSGELCIGGSQVAREYYNNPVLTKARFIQWNGEVLYKTGDIVRMLADGTFEFIGRADDQVKIRGLRVELDEINTVLKEAHLDVKDASTIVLKHDAGSKEQLVSFIALGDRKQHGSPPPVVQSSREELVTEVRKHAETMLPRYMVPGVILVLDHIPLSAAGKVDKKALGAIFQTQDIQSFSRAEMDGAEETWTADEQKIREVFAEISRVPVEQIRRSSTIYEIGLDSISASQVASKLKRLGVDVSVIDILERPSIELLSARLSEKIPQKAGKEKAIISKFQNKLRPVITAELGIDDGAITGVFPCTAVQEGMLSQFLQSQGKLYFNHILFKLQPDIDEEKLKSAWSSMFEATDILRSGFVEIDDDLHSFATVTYTSKHLGLPWQIFVGVEDVPSFVEAQKVAAAETALKGLHRPPWQLVFFRTVARECYVLFSGHHALYDANCLSIIFQDVADNYHGVGVPQRPQFAAVLEDIVAHTVDASVVDADREFWSKQLEGSSICRMPNLTPVRITAQTSHVKELRSAWNLSAIEAACKAQGVSLHAAGQAAWVRVLSAYTGETGLTVGVVFSGRTGLPAAEDVVFPCLVTLPSLCVLADKSNHQLALDIQSGNAQALKHQHAPLKSIQRWLEHPEESFFDSIFVYQKTEGGAQTTELPWKIVDDDANVDYTLSLEIEPAQDDHLLIRATAKDSHIPAEQTELLVRQFEAALVDILENPQGSATDLSGIPTELLSVTPAKVDEIPGDVTLLHKFVEKHRQLCPDKVAFEFVTAIEGDHVKKQTWTYAQLDDEGNRVANFLRSQGVTTGRIVGISFEKCPEASFAILGVLKAGCAYVAIDYSAPIDRKAFILEDSNAFAVLTMDKYVPELQAAVKVPVFSAESEAGIKTASTETPDLPDLTPDNLSYCLYTSGTTGTPKGCELTHENAVQAMYAFQRLFAPHWDENSRFLQFASFHFDVSVLEQFWSWSVGVCVTSAPRDLIFQDLAGSIHKMQITHLDLTPSLAALLRPEDVPNLCKGVFITGGEALKQEILDTWRDIGAIYNGYGPTEVTIGMTMYPRVPGNGKPSNIGPQFDNVGTYVFAPGTEKPVPRGALGELCAAGKLVGRGYLNRPELTAKSFPTLEKYGEKIYRTGDLVRILYDGTFDFAGRADDQVKLRGQRLEIGEINEVVEKADKSVEAVATLVLKHPKQQKDQLVSFIVVASPEFTAGAKEKPVVKTNGEYVQLISKLVAACKSKLPTYMVPTHFLPLSRMPLSVNNKVDNKALKALYQETTLEVLQQLARREEDVGEWTEAEKRVRAVLVEMAGVEVSEVKRSSTVFELGLDSVSVVGLSRRLKKSGFSAASPSLIMQNPAVSQMAIALTAGTTDSEFGRVEAARQQIAAFAIKNSFGITERLGLQPGDVHRILPCTSLQEGMIARFLDSDTPLYFNTFPMVLNADTNVARLRDAWETVVQATDILRTCFCETPDGYAQVILKRSTVRWEDVQISTEDFQAEAARGLLRAVAQNKTLYAPPVSVTCIKTPTRCVVSLNIFHAVYDGTSLPLILQDVIRAYQGEFSPRPTQFGDVVAHLLSTDLGEAQQFWKANIKPSKSLSLELLRAASVSASPLDHAEERKLDLDMDQLDALCKQLQCTPQAIFQAAWASVVSEYSGPVVTLGLVVSGRSLPLDDIEGVIGPTFNSIPGSFDVGDAASWESLIKAIHRFNSASLPFHHTPLRLIRKWLRRTSEQQLFDTLFVYQKDAGDESGPELWKIVPGAAVADYPLALEVAQSAAGTVTLTVVAKAELAREKVSEIVQSVAENLRSILANPQGKPQVQRASGQEDILVNGVGHELGSSKKDGFEWDERATILRKTIAELAEVDESEISADSSILELGLDSIEAIKLASRLRQHGIDLSVSIIMRNPTIRKMHAILDAASAPEAATGNKADPLAEFERRVRQTLDLQGVAAVYPTTPLQEAMIAETLASEYALYFNHDVLKLQEWVDIARLKGAWADVVKNNGILRTSFVSLEDLDVRQAYGQVVHTSTEFYWNEIEVADDDAVAEEIEAAMKRTKECADLLHEPPVYVTVLKAPRSSHFVLSISHALYDGWSIGLLHEDLKRAYLASITARPDPRLMIEQIVNTDIEESKRFWQQRLHGAVASRFPSSDASAAEPAQTHRAEKVSAVPFSEIQAFCKKVGATPQSLGQAVWALALAHHLGETDVVFGSVLSGRDFDGADEIMFPAMNTVPVRAILHGSYRDMLSYMQENGAMTLKHQHTPLREIQRLVNTGGTRLFDTIFLYQRSQASVDNERQLYDSVGGASDVEYNIAVELERAGNIITWRNACKSAVLSAAEGVQLLELLDSLLAHIVRNPEHPAVTYAPDGLIIGNAPAVKGSVQPVLNGVRVDLDAIAATLKEASDDIDNCAAIVINEGGNTVLVVFVSGPRAEAAIPTVISHAKKTLPYWSLPSYVLSTPNADIDRKKLQALFESLPDKQQYAVVQADDDWSPLEIKIRGILSKVSGIPEDEIQRTQTIFHLGLDSISAIRLASDLRKANVFLGVADILREATIERMAVAAGATATAEPSVDSKAVLAKALEGLDLETCLEGVSQDNVEAVYPITAGQLYMLESWESSNRTLFMPTFTFKCARTERSNIISAWEKLVQQEPLLRTIFRASGDKERPYIQVVLKDAPTQFTWLESSQPADAAFLRFLKTREVEKKVDLAQLPPARLCVQITPTETILFLTLHHALYDGVSLPLLLSRLQSLLQQSRPRLEGPKWVDFVGLTHSQDVEKQQGFWTQYLRGATSSLVAPKKESTSTQRTGVFRPRSITNAADMEAKCRKEGISLHAVFLAAFARVLSKRTGKEDVVFGVYLANRTLPLPELQNMTAPTLNIVPLRIQGAHSKSLLELAQQVQKDLVEIGRPENAVVDLLKIHKWTGVKVDAFFNFLKPAGNAAASAPTRSGGLVLEELQVEEETAVVKRPENMHVVVRYNGAHFWHGVWRALSLPFMPLAKFLWWLLSGRHRAGQAGQATKKEQVIGTHLDIEVAVREGAVDVGAFSNAAYLDVDELEEVVNAVCGWCVEEL